MTIMRYQGYQIASGLTYLGLKSSERICLMTCFKGHSSSIYNFAIRAFFFSHTSEDIEVFMA